MTQLDPQVNALIEAAIIWRQRDVGDDGPDAPVTGYERSLIEAVDAFLASRHTLREGSKADLEFGSAEALRAEETSVAAALEMLDKANRRANRFAEQLGDLGQGLRKRGIRVEPTGFDVAALDHIDRLTTALDEAARDAHVELEAVYDGGLSTDQEIRARALDAAARVLSGRDAYNLGDVAVMDAAAGTVALAARLLPFLAEGRACTCLAERGEHPHTARGCDIEHCACRWVPPPIDDADEARGATNGHLRYVDGYREAILRLRDDERYARAPEHLRSWNAEVRYGLADYLEQYYAPDPNDPWADAAESRVSAEERSDDKSKARPILDLGGSE